MSIAARGCTRSGKLPEVADEFMEYYRQRKERESTAHHWKYLKPGYDKGTVKQIKALGYLK